MDPARILVTPGASGALLLASQLLVQRGDRVLMADPTYPCNRHFMALAEAGYDFARTVLKPGGTLSSLGVYSSDLHIPLGAFAAGLGDHHIVTSLCPGGKERMRRLMAMVASGHADLGALVTHRFNLDQIEEAYELFGHQRDGVLKVAITP